MDQSERFARVNDACARHWGDDEIYFEPSTGGQFRIAAIFDEVFVYVDPQTQQQVQSTHPRIEIQDTQLVGAVPLENDRIRVGSVGGSGGRLYVFKGAPEPDGCGNTTYYLRRL